MSESLDGNLSNSHLRKPVVSARSNEPTVSHGRINQKKWRRGLLGESTLLASKDRLEIDRANVVARPHYFDPRLLTFPRWHNTGKTSPARHPGESRGCNND